MANSHTQAALNQFTANTDDDSEIPFPNRNGCWDEWPADAERTPSEIYADITSVGSELMG